MMLIFFGLALLTIGIPFAAGASLSSLGAVSTAGSMILFVGGIALTFVVTIYFVLRYYFAPMLAIDQGLWPADALRKSTAMTKGRKGEIIWMGVGAMLVILLGLIALVIGLIVAIPVVTMMVYSLYENFLKREEKTEI